MRRAKQFLPRKCLITIYNTMILPYFDYANVVWINCGEVNLEKLQKLQNMAMRVILGAPFRTHVKDMLDTLGFLNVRDRITYSTGCMMYKIINRMTPNYLSDQFKLVSESHSISTRSSSSGHLVITQCKTNHGKGTFQYKGSVTWNSISMEIRNSVSLDVFKKNLKRALR